MDPEGERVSEIVMDVAGVNLLRRTFYAASKDKDRRALRCVHFDGDAAVCTDSYRMAVAYFDGDPFPDLCVEVDSLREAVRTDKEWEVGSGNLYTYTGRYPKNWRELVERQRWSCDVTLPAGTKQYLRSAQQTLRTKSKGTTIAVDIDTSTGTLTAVRAADYTLEIEGSASTGSQCVVSGEPVGVIRLNLGFLADLLTATDTDVVALDIEGPLAPVMSRVPGLTQLLMPIRRAQ